MVNHTRVLLAKLIKRQGNMSNCDFAKSLGISKALWCHTKAGQKPIGKAVLTGIASYYKELIPDMLKFMDNGHEGSKTKGQ